MLAPTGCSIRGLTPPARLDLSIYPLEESMMKSRVWMFFVALAGLCWGVYVPLVAEGGKELHSAFAAFLCVGGAYFLLAVLLPIIILRARGKSPAWNGRGVTLSTLAG